MTENAPRAQTIDKDGINEILRKYRPSELGWAASRMCPSFEDSSREFTGAYGAMHRIAQSRLLVELQTELDYLRVRGETEGDGAVARYEFSLNGKKAELRGSPRAQPSEVKSMNWEESWTFSSVTLAE